MGDGGLVILLRLEELLRDGWFGRLFEQETQVEQGSITVGDCPLGVCVGDGGLDVAGLVLPTGPALLARGLLPLLG